MEEPLSTNYHVGLIIFLVVSAVVLAILVWAAVTRRQSEEHREEILFRLGYGLAAPPPQQLVAHIGMLYHRNAAKQPVELQNVYHRPIPGGEVYIFGLQDSGHHEAPDQADEALAVVSPTLDVPRLLLIPRPSILQEQAGVGGLLAGIADVAFDAIAAKTGLIELNYADDPEFAESFIVLVEDEPSARAFLDDRLRTQLLRWERRYVINAAQNTFVLTRSVANPAAPWSEDELRQAQDDAERALRSFRKFDLSYT